MNVNYEQKPYICPVCNGRGLVPHGFYNTQSYYSSTDVTEEICRSCGGSGIVWKTTY